MNMLDRLIASVSPKRGLARARARAAIMHYDAATAGRRGASFHAASSDADAAASKRDRLTFIARDMVRNTPFALRAQQVITGNVVGDGIIPKVVNAPDALNKAALALIENYLDTTAIDADGRQNLYGLQRLIMNTIVDSGEVLVVRELQVARPNGPLPLKIRVLEPDYLDSTKDGRLPGGNWIHNGIEFDAAGDRVAYHLFDQHPGSDYFRGVGWRSASSRVVAEDVLHIYRQDRPGQMRGVSWFAPIALNLQDLGDYQDAQIMRQKIAACFAAFRKVGADANAPTALGATLSPGLIQDIASDEEITFSNPPEISGFDEFMRGVLRAVAVGMGITYESATGDLSNVSFTSFKAGRMEMDRNISAWQWTMIIPQFLHPFGRWVLEAWASVSAGDLATFNAIRAARFDWVPPVRILVDPAREIPALTNAVRSGFASRSGVVRSLGFDPERLTEEIVADGKLAAQEGLIFDSDARHVSGSGVTQARPAGSELPTEESGDGK